MMIRRRIAIALAAASLGPAAGAALARGADAPNLAAPAAPAKHRAAEPRAARAKPVARRPAGPPAAPAPSPGRETEAASLERRRRDFFAPKPDAAAPDPGPPSAGVTLGGSGGISPGMGFKF